MIAKELGYRDRASAHNAVTAALATVLREPADNLVEVEQQRIDRGLVEVFRILDEDYPEPHIALGLNEVARLRLAKVWVETTGERSDLKLKAVDRLIRLSETRRKLLGLDQPAKTELDLGTAPVTVVFTGGAGPGAGSEARPHVTQPGTTIGEVRLDYTPTDRQAVAHKTIVDEMLYGGAAGGGKSRAGRVETILVPGSTSVIFRRTFLDLQRAVVEQMRQEMPPRVARYNEGKHLWRFRNGSIIELACLARDATGSTTRAPSTSSSSSRKSPSSPRPSTSTSSAGSEPLGR